MGGCLTIATGVVAETEDAMHTVTPCEVHPLGSPPFFTGDGCCTWGPSHRDHLGAWSKDSTTKRKPRREFGFRDLFYCWSNLRYTSSCLAGPLDFTPSPIPDPVASLVFAKNTDSWNVQTRKNILGRKEKASGPSSLRATKPACAAEEVARDAEVEESIGSIITVLSKVLTSWWPRFPR